MNQPDHQPDGRRARDTRASSKDSALAQSLAGMPTLVRDVLDELVQARETRSAVTLAVDLVERGRMSMAGDPVSLVVAAVEELAAAGLVKYTVRERNADMPLSIRVTKTGYIAAGYPIVHPETGSRAADHVRVDTGPTDWRSLDNATWGGPIERMHITDHLGLYPEHRSIHPNPLECGPRRTEHR